jgi:hypothetical protein
VFCGRTGLPLLAAPKLQKCQFRDCREGTSSVQTESSLGGGQCRKSHRGGALNSTRALCRPFGTRLEP